MMISAATSIVCSITVTQTRATTTVARTDQDPTRAAGTARRLDAATALETFTRALQNPRQGWLRFLFIRTEDTRTAAPNAETVANGLRAGHAACETIYRRGTELTNTAADAVSIASNLAGNGRIVTHGTLTRTGNRWSYSAEPPDRLVVPTTNGGTIHFTFGEIRGDMSSVSAFFGGDHSFSFRAVETDQLDMRFSTTRRNEARTMSAAGSVVQAGTRFEVDVRISGTERRVADAAGGESEARLRARGTLRAPDYRMDVDETAEISTASSEVRNGLSARSAVSISRRIDSTMTIGDDEYRWRGTRVQGSFRNGRPSQLDSYWRANGAITRNGGAFASYRMVNSRDRVSVVLTLDDREIELHSFSTR